jgi:hypothetical protein
VIGTLVPQATRSAALQAIKNIFVRIIETPK